MASSSRNVGGKLAHDRGQAVVEFALVLPLLFGFILFILDAALFGYTYVSAANAVREGARCAAVGGTSNAVKARVSAASGGLKATIITPTNPAYTPDPPVIGGSVTVSANMAYTWITPVGLIPGISSLTSYTRSSTMRMETTDITTKTSC